MKSKHLYSAQCAFLVVAVVAAPALATTGGEQLARALGWDPIAKRVYVQSIIVDESGEFGQVFYFALDSKEPTKVKRLAWSVANYNDSIAAQRLRALERRLRPMVLEDATSIPKVVIARMDTVRTPYYVGPRFVVHLSVWRNRFRKVLEITTYREPTVVLHRIYQVPGREESIVILSFIGIPHEGGYETQIPVLVHGGGSDTLRVSASRDLR